MKKNKKISPLKISVIFCGIGLIYITLTAFSPIKRNIIKENRINILLLGISETDYAKFAEVIKIISYEPVTGFFDIISIPRDTMIKVDKDISWRGFQKLDEVYSRYRRKHNNPNKLFLEFKSKIEEFMQNYLSIDYYVQVDYKAFEEFIDELGGIELEVVKKMDYDDTAQNLHIHISTGINKFNGKQALKYVRYRDKLRGDIARQERQHKFLRIVLEKLKYPGTLPRVPSLVSAVKRNVNTNMSLADILVLVDELRNMEIKNFRIQKIPGEPVMRWSKSYWKADDVKLKEVLDVVENSYRINMPVREVNKQAKLNRRITAEVWNATNRKDIARNLSIYLRKRNVDVVRWGNYGVYKKYTQVISRTGDLRPAREVSEIIGTRNLKTELDKSRMVDINIVIGSDFKPLWEK
ncbi:MAG: LCP family protein [Elusimicrobiota bacterium]